MEARIIVPEDPKPKAPYPCLKKSTKDGTLIVLFKSPGTGVVVFPNDEDLLGDYFFDWKEEYFEPLARGIEIVLKN